MKKAAGCVCRFRQLGRRMKINRIDRITLLSIAKGTTAVWLSLALFGLTACTDGANPSSARGERLLVTASIAPLADFARQVGGDHVGVITLVPPRASPHTFEPIPSQLAQMARARVLVLNGVGLEYWAGRLIEGVDNPKLVVVDTSQGIDILERDGDRPGGNPHIWLDPQNAVVQVSHIRDALIRADPAHADDYRANAERYVSELRTLDEEIADEVATWSKREFIAFHPAWVYFARRYGLKQAAVIEVAPGREPSPAEVAHIIETAKHIGAKAIFAEPQFSSKAAQTLAEETGAQVLFLDPLGSSLDDSGYLNLMRDNVAQMVSALR
jgi:zinc transport system substrate-binding protein